MKKEYIKPQSILYSVEFNENIATSGGSDSVGDDSVAGSMVILFSQSVSPCREYYTKSDKKVTVPDGSSFVQYFLEMQGLGAPVGCLFLV